MRSCAALPYLAGFFDGEGCIGIYRTKGCKDSRYKSGRKSPSWIRMVTINNCHRATLQLFKDQFGGKIRFLQPGVNKKIYCWQIARQDVICACLTAMLPWLKRTRKQAIVMLKHYENTKALTFTAARILKRLKKL